MFVSLGAMRASLAFEGRLGDAILRRCVPTVFAAVRGVPGVDLNPDTPSIFRFGAQNRDEPAPAGVTYASAEPGPRPGPVGQILAGVVWVGHGFGPPQHVGDLQILHHQQVVAAYEGAGLFVVKVLALVGDLAMSRRDGFPLAFPVLRPTLGALQPLLPAANRSAAARPQRGLSMCSPSLVVAKLTIPTSTPACRPVAGNGFVGTSSQDSTSIQRRPWRLTWIVFTRPTTGRCT